MAVARWHDFCFTSLSLFVRQTSRAMHDVCERESHEYFVGFALIMNFASLRLSRTFLVCRSCLLCQRRNVLNMIKTFIISKFTICGRR